MTTIAIVKHAQGCYSIDQIRIREDGPKYLCQEAFWYRSPVARAAIKAARADAARIAAERGFDVHPDVLEIGAINHR